MSAQFNDIFTELESWYGGERGQYLLRQLRAALRPHLENAFGYHILQMGPLRGASGGVRGGGGGGGAPL